MGQPLDLPCVSCGGRRYHRTAAGWARCAACWVMTLSQTYIKPALRQGEIDLPPTVLADEPWPLTSRVEGGSYDTFRWQVWRSLVHYYDTRRLTYDCVTAWRLNEICFERDAEYTSLGQLHTLDLLILLVGVADLPNSLLPSLIQNVQGTRHLEGRPTWTYRGHAASAPKLGLTLGPPSASLTIRDVTR